MTDVRMPALADGMEQGTIVKWLAAAGEAVAAGDELVEIETDKATVAYEADADGTLEIVAAEGATVAVGELIARVGEASASPAPEVEVEAEEFQPVPAATNGNGALATATPLARRVAAAHAVDLAALDGSGPGGRVLKADVLRAAGLPDEEVPAAPAAARPAAVPTIGGRLVQPSRIQRVGAERMAAAKATVPHFQVATEVELDAALELRAGLKAAAGDAPAPSVNDLVVRACALALREHPLVNGSYTEAGYELHDAVHVGIAVAADDGLVVATVRDADMLALGALAAETRRLAEAVRAGRAAPRELSGATFTVSNLGMFGMTAITPVINPPQAAILGVGAAREVLARAAGGEVVDRRQATFTLSGDHRILNGADAARFLADVRALLETPLKLVI